MGRSFENRKQSIMKTAGQKSKLYARYGKQLYVVAKNGVPDPAGNPALRIMIEKAKKEQVPSHVIEKAIEKAKGGSGEEYTPARYEGFGPGGCSVIIDCLTDNPNRTISDIRTCFTKCSAKLGAAGSVSHQFDHLAVLSFAGEDEDGLLEAMLEAEVDVDDIEAKDGRLTLFAPPAEFAKARDAVMAVFPETEFEVQEVTFIPQNEVTLSEEDAAALDKFINMLNDCEDIQDVYHNAQRPG